jgi:hypothetical protein
VKEHISRVRHHIAHLVRTRPSWSIGGWPSSSNWHNGKLRPWCSAKSGPPLRYRGVGRCFAIGRCLHSQLLLLPGRVKASVYPYTIAVYSSTSTLDASRAACPRRRRCFTRLLSQRAVVLSSPRRQPRKTSLSAPVTPRPRSLVRFHLHHRVHCIILNHCHGWPSGALVANTAFTTAPPNHCIYRPSTQPSTDRNKPHLLPAAHAALSRIAMDPNNSLPPPRHAPPHIRINSGNEDLLELQDDPQARPQPSRQASSRSLTSSAAAAAPAGLYAAQSQGLQESAEHLLPPTRTRTRRLRDDDSVGSQSQSGFNSRRTSWSSESAGSRNSRIYDGPFVSPFDDSRAPSRAGSDDDVNTQTVSEKYNILPSAGLLLFPEDVEKDDYLHNPDPNDKDKMKFSELFTKRGFLNVGGLALITLGLLTLFIGYPIMYVLGKICLHLYGILLTCAPQYIRAG